MHIVDSLVHADSDAPLITEFYQTFKIQNGDSLFKYFNRIAKPQILMFDDYPFYWPGNEVKSQEFERLRSELQRVYNYKPGFFYVAQSYGYIKNFPNHWRRPDTSELKAEVMLALSHGAKGIFFWTYDVSSNDDLRNAIVDANGNHSELWNVIHNNLVPRLYGNLGNTLMDLNYTGDYIERKYNAAAKELFPSPQNYDYLTLGLHAAAHEMHWHTGFLVNKNYPDDKYFLLANLNTENNESITVKVTPPVTGYTNYRFRNIEDGYFDTTFSTQITKTLTHSAGEGYLYEVAPVVEYGGKLIYNETITNSKSLQNKMTIENGATLTINGTFDCYDDIILKSGAAISTTNNQRDENGPKIIMHHGHKIIIEANATVNLNVIILYR